MLGVKKFLDGEYMDEDDELANQEAELIREAAEASCEHEMREEEQRKVASAVDKGAAKNRLVHQFADDLILQHGMDPDSAISEAILNMSDVCGNLDGHDTSNRLSGILVLCVHVKQFSICPTSQQRL